MNKNNGACDPREMAAVIMKVRGGQLSVKEAAKLLGISRKTYYQWEQKALAAMMGALEPGKPGRPKTPVDAEKEALKAENKQLLQKLTLAEARLQIRAILNEEPIPGVPEIPVKKKEKRGDDSKDPSSDGASA